MAAPKTRADQLHIYFTADVAPYMPPIRTLPGVILSAVLFSRLGGSYRNGTGRGQLQAEDDGKLLSWRAPGSTKFGPGVRVSADGEHLLEDGEDPGKFLHADVVHAHLPSGPMMQPVYFQEVRNAYFAADISAAQAAAGSTLTFTFTAKNIGTSLIYNVKVWLDVLTPYLSISGDDVTYVTPKTEGEALVLGNVNGGATKTFYVKRTIPAGSEADGRVRAWLRASWDGV